MEPSYQGISPDFRIQSPCQRAFSLKFLFPIKFPNETEFLLASWNLSAQSSADREVFESPNFGRRIRPSSRSYVTRACSLRARNRIAKTRDQRRETRFGNIFLPCEILILREIPKWRKI